VLKWLRYSLLALLALFLASIPLAPQFSTGSIQGVVMNDRGPIQNASITARETMTGEESQAKSDAIGHYKIEELKPGRYSLWAQAAGHDSCWIPAVVLDYGQTAYQDIRLGRIRASVGTH
jgi:Carboxypeptidase regulatory-like domain